MPGVLIVEDEQDVRDMLKKILERHDYTVMTASNGRDALAKFKSVITDLVITDIIMPEEDGIGLIVDLRKQKPDLKIIAISGGGKVGPTNYLNIAETLGADAIFTKPFNMNEFVKKVDELMEGS